MARLYWTFALVLFVAVVELLGAYFSHSLSLASDGVHMLGDVNGMGIAVVAGRIAGRLPWRRDRQRVESRAAYWSMTLLMGVALLIIAFALWRFFHPVSIESGLMLSIATLGLLVNGVVLVLLNKGRKESLNVKAAHFHVFSDTLTSLGVLAAAGLIFLTERTWIDAAVGMAIGVIIFLGAHHLRHSSRNRLHELGR